MVDEEYTAEESGNERNGVGNPVPLSPGDGRLDGEGEPGESQSSRGTLFFGLECFSIAATRRSNTELHQPNGSYYTLADCSRINFLTHRSNAQSQTSTRATSAVSGSSRRTSNSQGGIQGSLASFFDPEARQSREMESSLSQFYALRLQDATSTINRLQDEANRLREGINIPVLRLQEELQQVRKELAEKTSKNQTLKHSFEMLQLRMELSHQVPATLQASGPSPYLRNLFANPIPFHSAASTSNLFHSAAPNSTPFPSSSTREGQNGAPPPNTQ
ncbi:hypothetical protein PtB15_11B393 [Puccinia triticina]|nr:hypothetical protein PtB15_11B393 [Puccinia triticina]